MVVAVVEVVGVVLMVIVVAEAVVVVIVFDVSWLLKCSTNMYRVSQ